MHCRRATPISLVLAYWTWLRLSSLLLKGTAAAWPTQSFPTATTTLKLGPELEKRLQCTQGKAESQGQPSNVAAAGRLMLTTFQEDCPPACPSVTTDTSAILALDTALERLHLIQLQGTSNRHQSSI